MAAFYHLGLNGQYMGQRYCTDEERDELFAKGWHIMQPPAFTQDQLRVLVRQEARARVAAIASPLEQLQMMQRGLRYAHKRLDVQLLTSAEQADLDAGRAIDAQIMVIQEREAELLAMTTIPQTEAERWP